MRKAKGAGLLRDGQRSEAIKQFQRSIDITPEMALDFIKVLN